MEQLEQLMSEAMGQLTKDPELTKRELEIIELVALGYTSQYIAIGLVISTRTVEAHKTNIMNKMGVNNSSHMISRAYRLGILKID